MDANDVPSFVAASVTAWMLGVMVLRLSASAPTPIVRQRRQGLLHGRSVLSLRSSTEGFGDAEVTLGLFVWIQVVGTYGA